MSQLSIAEGDWDHLEADVQFQEYLYYGNDVIRYEVQML
jgi:hypothetical protein